MSERPMISKGSDSNPWNPKHPPQPFKESTNLCAYLDKEIGIEAMVKINPDVSVGEVTIECLESMVDRHSFQQHSSEDCTVYINQLVRIQIPVHIRVNAKAEECGVICHKDIDESSD